MYLPVILGTFTRSSLAAPQSPPCSQQNVYSAGAARSKTLRDQAQARIAPQVPAAVPVRPDTYYFALDAKGQMYDRMLQAQSISIYVPSGLRDLKLDLVAVTS
jgi:hypothetical protein